MLTLQRQPKNKKPDLEKMDQIIGATQLPDGSILPEGYCIWEGKSYMYLGKLVDGEWLRYGNQGWRWWCKCDYWKGIQEWIEEVNSQDFITQYGSNNPPLEENRIYETSPRRR